MCKEQPWEQYLSPKSDLQQATYVHVSAQGLHSSDRLFSRSESNQAQIIQELTAALIQVWDEIPQ